MFTTLHAARAQTHTRSALLVRHCAKEPASRHLARIHPTPTGQGVRHAAHTCTRLHYTFAARGKRGQRHTASTGTTRPSTTTAVNSSAYVQRDLAAVPAQRHGRLLDAVHGEVEDGRRRLRRGQRLGRCVVGQARGPGYNVRGHGAQRPTASGKGTYTPQRHEESRCGVRGWRRLALCQTCRVPSAEPSRKSMTRHHFTT